jgi:hypothetical protein
MPPETTPQTGANAMKTPYEEHAELNHHMTRYSPNGIDIIEECSECGARFLHNPSIGYPISLSPRTCNIK